jgi:hypothetical protein
MWGRTGFLSKLNYFCQKFERMKSFEHWKYEALELSFGLKRVPQLPLLQQWLAAQVTPNQVERPLLDLLRQKAESRVESWNEGELKLFFIGPLLSLVDYNGEEFGAFTQRLFQASLNDRKGNSIEMKGRVELVVAMGKQEPREPFFFFHEYKQEKRRDNDPLGQLLAAMLVAQEQNARNRPLYGCYVVRRMCFFTVLDEKKYGLSRAYDITQQGDLLSVFSILRQARLDIEKQVPALLLAA